MSLSSDIGCPVGGRLKAGLDGSDQSDREPCPEDAPPMVGGDAPEDAVGARDMSGDGPILKAESVLKAVCAFAPMLLGDMRCSRLKSVDSGK